MTSPFSSLNLIQLSQRLHLTYTFTQIFLSSLGEYFDDASCTNKAGEKRMKSNRILNRIADIIRFLTSRAYRRNQRENTLIEAYFRNRGLDYSDAIFRAWRDFDENSQTDKVSRGHYELGNNGKIRIVLQGDMDQHLANYDVTTEMIVKKVI